MREHRKSGKFPPADVRGSTVAMVRCMTNQGPRPGIPPPFSVPRVQLRNVLLALSPSREGGYFLISRQVGETPFSPFHPTTALYRLPFRPPVPFTRGVSYFYIGKASATLQLLSRRPHASGRGEESRGGSGHFSPPTAPHADLEGQLWQYICWRSTSSSVILSILAPKEVSEKEEEDLSKSERS